MSGAPEPEVVPALEGTGAGDEVILITWLDRGDRDVLQVHPRDDPTQPKRAMFGTRSHDRPNPIGLHRVKLLAISAPTSPSASSIRCR